MRPAGGPVALTHYTLSWIPISHSRIHFSGSDGGVRGGDELTGHARSPWTPSRVMCPESCSPPRLKFGTPIRNDGYSVWEPMWQ